MTSDDMLKFISTVGLPGFLIIWGVWLATFKIWPWYRDDYWKQKSQESLKRLELEEKQTVIITGIQQLLGELKQTTLAIRDVVMATQAQLQEHRINSQVAIDEISNLKIDMALLKAVVKSPMNVPQAEKKQNQE
jgi:hypothetical protein